MTSSRRTRAPKEAVDAEAVVAAPQPAGAAERSEVAEAAAVAPQGGVGVGVHPVVVVAVAGVAEEGLEEAELSGESLRFSGNG